MKLVKSATFEANETQQVILQSMSLAASKLWNVGNYEKRTYKEQGMASFPNWYDQKKRLKTHYWFKALPSHTAQLVLKKLDDSWKSFFALVESGGIANPRSPRYKQTGIFIPFDATTAIKAEKDGTFRFTITKQERAFLKETYGIEVDFLCLNLPYFKGLTNIKEVTLYPERDNKWKAIAVYEVSDVEPLPDNRKYLSIDLGIRNFATCYSSNGESFILAKKFLELNHYYNKNIAHYQSISDAQQAAAGVKYPKKSKRVLGLYEKYRNSVNDLLHKASTYVRDYCVSNNINTVIVGDITGIRDGSNLGHRNNQAFHALPYKKFTDMLSYKLALAGINLVYQKESFSSQCSPLSPRVSKRYAVPKQRVSRGLYNDSGRIFNADAVGAYNILRLAHKEESFPLPYRTAKVSV